MLPAVVGRFAGAFAARSVPRATLPLVTAYPPQRQRMRNSSACPGQGVSPAITPEEIATFQVRARPMLTAREQHEG